MTVDACLARYLSQHGQPFPGTRGKVAEIIGSPDADSVWRVVVMMGQWAAAGGGR